MPRNLENVISKSPEQLTDTNKLKIIIGIVSGLLEMYNKNIVHRNLKPQCILLNDNFEPVISDFLFPVKQEISIQIMLDHPFICRLNFIMMI